MLVKYPFCNASWCNVINCSRPLLDTSKEEAQREFDEFYREVFVEIDDEYGRIEEMNVCDNVGEHMLGNVYVKVCVFHFTCLLGLETYIQLCNQLGEEWHWGRQCLGDGAQPTKLFVALSRWNRVECKQIIKQLPPTLVNDDVRGWSHTTSCSTLPLLRALVPHSRIRRHSTALLHHLTQLF